MEKRYFTILVGLLVISTQLWAQKVQFSQYYAAPLVLSPSYAGLIDGSRIVLNYRDQWPNIPGTFTTFACSYDQYFDRMKSGIGISFVRDRAGSGNLSLTDVGLLYSYDIKINRFWHVRPGIKFKWGQRGIDISKLVFGDQLHLDDPNTPSSGEAGNYWPKTNYLDVDASALAYHKNYWAGVSFSNLLRPNQTLLQGNETRVPIKVAVFGGARIPIKGDRMRRHEITESVTFAGLYQIQDGGDQLDIGAYWKKSPFTLGLWLRSLPGFARKDAYRGLDAIVLMFGFEIYDLRFGYSYDYTLSKIHNNVTGGAHEISIIYEFNKNMKIRRKQRPMVIPCPSL